MFDGSIEVATTALRATAADLAATGFRLGHGLAGTAGLTVSAPGWAATAALAQLEAAVHTSFAQLGARVAEAGTGLLAVADGYDAADHRAAERMTRVQ
jgi:hypothetical protein